jgi:16S rRNA (guanine527-N7)-methyltransferase
VVNESDDLPARLTTEYGLPAGSAERLRLLAERCVSLEISGTAVRSVDDALQSHIADSLAGLRLAAIREAETMIDIGTGVGFPGIVLALALPELKLTLLDSVRKKVEAAAALCRELELANVECVWSRVEQFSALGSPARERFDVVTARALASLNVLIEYAAPLLRVGGSIVAWKGDPEAAELADAAAAESTLGYWPGELLASKPFAGSLRRHFYVAVKRHPADRSYPRRPGAALRKPITAGTPA